jgi:hypothetical protein
MNSEFSCTEEIDFYQVREAPFIRRRQSICATNKNKPQHVSLTAAEDKLC